MKEVIEKIEILKKTSEHEIASEFRKLLPEKGNEISMELRAESMAFDFMENYTNKDTGWGTYFGPMIVWNNGDGTSTESPSIRLVTPEMMEYWTRRLNQTTNPILKARYSGLVWDFSKPVLNSNPDFKIGIEYVKSLIATVESRNYRYETDLITKIKRATQVAISLNATDLIEKAKIATIELENEIAENDKPGLWGFSFDILVGNKKVNLTAEEEEKIIKTLELRFEELSNEPKLNPWNAEAAAERIAEYYRKKGDEQKVKEIILQLGKAYEANEKTGNAMQVSSWLQHLHKIYATYGLNDEANAVLIRLRELGPKINEELQPISSSFEIPKDKLDAFINFMVDGEPKLIFHKIIQNFIPKKDEIKDRMFGQAKTAPLTYLIPTSIQDNKGRVIATIGSLEDDLDGNLIHELSQSLSFQAIFVRHIFYKIITDKILDVNDFMDFIEDSPVFSESRKPIIQRGIQAYYDNDLIVAIHILIPQIEEAIRNLIELAGGVVLKKNRGGGFQLKTFDDILRDEIIKQVLGENIQLYLRVLFTDPRGWNLRNDVCHGMSEIEFFSFQSIERILHVMLILGTIIKK
ncbi:MAG: DUF4209 domain-containing protein [Proteiniphilum sp.]|nr:DUF4209 domain-containing protein [Synergistaceae bacterium]MDD5620345.1 DUF4209 domain-containing protein [Proteiniphilum sp.]